MNKNYLIVSVSILLVGLAFGGILFYNHQGDLNLKKQQLEFDQQKEQNKTDATKKEAEQKTSESLSNNLKYTSCVAQATTARDNALKVNSQYETKDENGGVVYHGNATVFDNIESDYQQEKARCGNLFRS